MIPEANVWPVHPDIPDRFAAIMDPLGNAVHTVMANAPWIATSDQLEAALRQYFERARVSERVLAAEPEPTWYVYRDAPGRG